MNADFGVDKKGRANGLPSDSWPKVILANGLGDGQERYIQAEDSNV